MAKNDDAAYYGGSSGGSSSVNISRFSKEVQKAYRTDGQFQEGLDYLWKNTKQDDATKIAGLEKLFKSNPESVRRYSGLNPQSQLNVNVSSNPSTRTAPQQQGDDYSSAIQELYASLAGSESGFTEAEARELAKRAEDRVNKDNAYLSQQLKIDNDALTRSSESFFAFLSSERAGLETDKELDINALNRNFERNLRDSKEVFVEQRSAINRGYSQAASQTTEGLAASNAASQTQLRSAGLQNSSVAEQSSAYNRLFGEQAFSDLRDNLSLSQAGNQASYDRNVRSATEARGEGLLGINRRYGEQFRRLDNQRTDAEFNLNEGLRQNQQNYLLGKAGNEFTAGRFVEGLNIQGGIDLNKELSDRFYSRESLLKTAALYPSGYTDVSNPVIRTPGSYNHPRNTYTEPEVSPFISTEQRTNTRPDNQPR